MNLDDLVAIDFHTHAEEPCDCARDDGYDEFQAGMAAYFRNPAGRARHAADGAGDRRLLPRAQDRRGDLPRRCRTRDRLSPLFQRGGRAASRPRTADILIPFASHRPRQGQGRRARGAAAGARLRRARASSSTRPCRASTPTTAWPIRSTRRSPRKARSRSSTPGQTGVGSGMRGGMGMRLKYSNPMHLDDVAVDFPDMPIVLAHPSFPWQEEALAVAPAQAERLHRPVGLVAEVLPAAPRAVRQHDAEAQDAVRLRLARDHARPLADGFRRHRHPGRGPPLILKENARRLLKI